MPFAAVHTITALESFNHIKNKFSLQKYTGPHVMFVVALGGVLPDIDLPLNIVLSTFGYSLAHGSYTHTLFFAFLFFLPAMILLLLKKYKAALYLLIISGGITLHLFLDYFIGGGAREGIMWLFPLSDTPYKIHLMSYVPIRNVPESLDALTLLMWIYLKSPLILKNK